MKPIFSCAIMLGMIYAIVPVSADSSHKKSQVLTSMNSFLHVLDDNESWNKLVPYIDFPDAGVPDCGMFIESYSSHLLTINGSDARVRVKFSVVGEFAGTKYYHYPTAIKREITYRLKYTNRSWSTIDESGITNYVPLYNDNYLWKVRTATISFMNIKYMPWHMRYYSPDNTPRLEYRLPTKHCWSN